MFEKEDLYIFPELESDMWHRVIKYGFRVRHQTRGIKFDEKNATFLQDVISDPVTGLQIGDPVTIEGHLQPKCIRSFRLEEGEGYYYLNRLFRVLGFVEVVGTIGKCKIKFLYCALATYGVADTDEPKVCFDEGKSKQKVHLYWLGSLEKVNS